MDFKTNAQRKPPTPQQILAQQTALHVADKQRAATDAFGLPALVEKKPPAVQDNRSAHERHLDDVAPATVVGRMIKFNKEGKVVTSDDDQEVSEETDFIALCDQTLIGWVKFNGKGEAPSREMGLLYDGFVMPDRESLDDSDQTQWELGLNGQPADPWQHHQCLVLQQVDTSELFTYTTSSITGRRAVGTLLKHYDRMQKSHHGYYPLVRLKVGGFQHRDERVGWVPTPVLAAIGRVPGEAAVSPAPANFGGDAIPF